MQALPSSIDWHDYWSSHDPVPRTALDVPPTASEEASKPRSHETWNLRDSQADHTVYWENDEEFLIPLIEVIDRVPGTLPASRRGFAWQYQGYWAGRRASRVMVRALWRRSVALAAGIVVLASVQPLRSPRLSATSAVPLARRLPTCQASASLQTYLR